MELTLPDELVGAEAVHREFRRWLVALGHDRYAEQPVRVAPGADPVRRIEQIVERSEQHG